MTKKMVGIVSLATAAAFGQIAVNGSRTFVGNLRVKYPNASTTGTVLNRLAKLTGSPATAVRSSAGDTNEAVGVVVGGNGTSGDAEIAFTGKASCEFDGATTAGNYVQISATLAGACHDSGAATLPASGQVVGRVTSTNASAGVYEVDLTSRTNYPAAAVLTTLTGSLRVAYPNTSSTGTTLNRLAKLTGAPSTALIVSTSDTTGAMGIVVAGAGTTGNAEVAFTGKASCVFDGATVATHYVQISTTSAGACHDAGAGIPTSGQIIGMVTTTNASAGTYEVDLTIRQLNTSAGGQVPRSFGATFDGGGSGLSAGTTIARYLVVPYSCTITSFDITVDSGTAGFKVWRKATGTALPTLSDSITSSNLSISTGTALHSTTLTSFTSTAIAANDIIAINLSAASGATLATFGVQCQ